VVAAGAAAATIVDLRTRRIPNELTAALSGVGIGLAAAGVTGISGGAAIAGFFVGLCLMLPGYALGATGAGDVKLMAAMGAVLGPVMVLSAFLFTAVSGGVIALAVAVRRRRLGATLAGTGRMLSAPAAVRSEVGKATTRSRFAYGPAIATGCLLAALIG
jgi:prepilin peptidase CpaA